MAAWRPLKLSNSASAHLPLFLISSEFNNDSYLVQLTDLTNTWVESVDRDAIIERSREGNTSIDPSEDEDQLSIFLEKIGLGLAGGNDTSLCLQVGPDIGDISPTILLHVTIQLPGGLKDLEWRYELALQTPKETVDKLLLPSLIALQEKKKDFEGLVELLEEKDAVIQKLVDTLENQGTDLGTIFHQVAGRPGKKTDRKKASEKIQGLKIFDVKAWRQKSGSDKPDDKWELLNNVFGGNDISPNLSKTNSLDKEDRKHNWWEHIQGKRVGTLGSKLATNTTDSSWRSTQQEHTQPEDDFQVQSTPPHLSRTRAKPDVLMDDSTDDDDDDDLDAPSQRSRVPDNLSISQARAPSPDRTISPSPPRAKPLVKLGTKRKASTPTPPGQNAEDTTEDDEPIPDSLHSTNAINNNDNDTTDDDGPSSPPPKRQQTPKTSPAKQKGKLGKIGGKKAPSPSPEPESEPEPEPIVEPEAIKVRPKRGMLGKIGGKKKETASIPDIDSQSSVSPKKKLGTIGGRKTAIEGASQGEDIPDEVNRGRGRALTTEETGKSREKTPPPRETSEERADKKRAILKKELEAKSKAPAKKIRKF
ncbi:hypothetical protein BTUL_0029g00640 [Botrytis tulipae]|uniref:Non-homologous end-joining factor 1 n=1 Tax=Botrytis tulipae TaxID=87230 RepID=A0A4Z1F0Y7_9HELO|nr:hypothetical protein BTUL_0029g00640 [Botrytis tulipae]